MLKSLLFLFLSASFAFPQSGAVLRVQAKFNSITAFSVNFKQTGTGFAKLSGKLSYRAKSGYKIDLGGMQIISNGTTTWNYNKKDKKVIISNASSSDESLLSLDAIINDYPAQCSVSEEVKGSSVIITMIPQKKAIRYKQIIIEAASDNLVSNVMLKTNDNKTMKLEFTGYQLNASLTDADFTFEIPKGAKVIDLR